MRVAPLLRASELRALRGLIRAAPAEWPYRHGALEQRVGELEGLHPELGFPYPPEPTPIPELAAAGSPTIDRAADRQGQAPEGTRGAAAAVEMVPANACPAAQPVLRDAPSSFDKLRTSVAPQDHREEEETAADFAARVAAASARRARVLARPEPTLRDAPGGAPQGDRKMDWSRVAEAHARKASEPRPVAVVRALAPALSPEECRRCGIPGRKGCDHQAPFVPEPVAASPYSMGKRNSYRHQGARA